MPATSQPRVGLIGVGAWGGNHLRVGTAIGALRAVCDTSGTKLEQVRSTHPGLQRYREAEELLDRDDIDAVVIASPAATHADLAVAAMERGKDVLVEKPLALTVAEGQRVERTARAHGRTVLVGHVLLYHPAFRALRKLIENGALGQLRYLHSSRLNIGTIRTEENALWSFAPHDIAMILALAKAPPNSVVCHGRGYLRRNVADVTLTALGFASELRAHVFVSWLHPFKEHRFVAVGSEAMAVFDDMLPWQEKLLLYPHRVSWQDGHHPVAHRADGVPQALNPVEPLRAEWEHFLRCLTERSDEPQTNPEAGVAVLEVLEKAQHSLVSAEGSAAKPTDNGVATLGPKVFVHRTAEVEEGASVGPGTKVWHGAQVMSGAVVGRDCMLGKNAFVATGARLGDRVRLQNNVSVYDGVEIEDDVFCGPSMVFTNVLRPRTHVDQKDAFAKTKVGKGATLGANATIVCGVNIGSYAFVGAGSVVTRDVPCFGLVYGNPARLRGWVCERGQRLDVDNGARLSDKNPERQVRCGACGKSFIVGDGPLVFACPADHSP